MSGVERTPGVLQDVLKERERQVAQYGENADLEDGMGPQSRWLEPFAGTPAWLVEQIFRGNYERHEKENGKPTWMHLIREELAEAFTEADLEKRRAEMVQVAALCVSYVEKLDARMEGS